MTWWADIAAMISSRRADTGRDSGNSICKGMEDKGETSVKIKGLGVVIADGMTVSNYQCKPHF
jgi:hypothetical protein